MGVYCRIAGELEASGKYLNEAKLNFKGKEKTKFFYINEIRLAQTLQFQKRNEAADLMHNKIIFEIKNQFEDLMDFVFQHKGKNFFEWGKFSEAKAAIEKALELRIIKGDEALIRSSQKALEVINFKIIK